VRPQDFALWCFLALQVACSPSAPAPLACDPRHCAQGNECIDDHSGSGPTCHRVCTQQADCPSGWFCNDGLPGGTKSWCVQNTRVIASQPGQWGASCKPACDTADGFACYGRSPTDANAFCTLFDCAKDSDRVGGWWCARIDTAPNVNTIGRSFGSVEHACLPRQYCAPCTADHDCTLAADGTRQHCVSDAKGSRFCGPQCASDDGCAPDAICTRQWTLCVQSTCAVDGDCARLAGAADRCIAGACQQPCSTTADCSASGGSPRHCVAGVCAAQSCLSDDDCPPAGGTYRHCMGGACAPECAGASDCEKDQTCQSASVCTPRAGVCVGDGTFCSPCRSDADCLHGYCLVADYSPERFCSQTATGGDCAPDAGPSFPGCPPRAPNANYKGVTCTTSSTDFAPANQCVGYVLLGTSTGVQQAGAGCWTLNR
jgi:hypothetical protein